MRSELAESSLESGMDEDLGEIRYEIRYDDRNEIIEVFVHEARELFSAESLSIYHNVYVTVELIPLSTAQINTNEKSIFEQSEPIYVLTKSKSNKKHWWKRHKHEKKYKNLTPTPTFEPTMYIDEDDYNLPPAFSTEVLSHSANPEWNCVVTYKDLSESELSKFSIRLTVTERLFDRYSCTYVDQPIGKTEVSLNTLLNRKQTPNWAPAFLPPEMQINRTMGQTNNCDYQLEPPVIHDRHHSLPNLCSQDKRNETVAEGDMWNEKALGACRQLYRLEEARSSVPQLPTQLARRDKDFLLSWIDDAIAVTGVQPRGYNDDELKMHVDRLPSLTPSDELVLLESASILAYKAQRKHLDDTKQRKPRKVQPRPIPQSTETIRAVVTSNIRKEEKTLQRTSTFDHRIKTAHQLVENDLTKLSLTTINGWKYLQRVPGTRPRWGQLMISLLYLPSTSKIVLMIIKGQHMQSASGKLCSLRVTIEFGITTTASALTINNNVKQLETRLKTTSTNTCHNTNCPVWNESFTFKATPNEIPHVFLDLRVRGNQNILLGCFRIAHNSRKRAAEHWQHMLNMPQRPIAKWYPVHV